MPKLEKGSAAAKERMAHLRSLRNKKEVGTGGFCSKCSKDSTNSDSLETRMKKKAGEKQQFHYDDNEFAGVDFEKPSTLLHDTVVQNPASKHKANGKGLPRKSPWIKWVADYAHKNNMNYFEALKDPNVKKGYHSQK